MRHLLAGITLFLCLTVSSLQASWTDWSPKIAKAEIGQSRQDIQEVMGEFTSKNWSQFREEYACRLGFLGEVPADIWLVDAKTLETEGGQTYVIAIYSKDGRLVDLLRFRAAMFLAPMRAGEYTKRLASIKKGMNADDIYRLLGQEMPFLYSRDEKTKKWKVTLSYPGVGSSFWSYSVDAATGEVLETHAHAD